MENELIHAGNSRNSYAFSQRFRLIIKFLSYIKQRNFEPSFDESNVYQCLLRGLKFLPVKSICHYIFVRSTGADTIVQKVLHFDFSWYDIKGLTISDIRNLVPSWLRIHQKEILCISTFFLCTSGLASLFEAWLGIILDCCCKKKLLYMSWIDSWD